MIFPGWASAEIASTSHAKGPLHQHTLIAIEILERMEVAPFNSDGLSGPNSFLYTPYSVLRTEYVYGFPTARSGSQLPVCYFVLYFYIFLLRNDPGTRESQQIEKSNAN